MPCERCVQRRLMLSCFEEHMSERHSAGTKATGRAAVLVSLQEQMMCIR